MKVLFDLQPFQSESRFHGIGRVTFELSRCLVSKIKESCVLINTINTIEGINIRNSFKTTNPEISFDVLVLDGFTNYYDLYLRNRKIESFVVYELLYEWKVSQINPDILFIFSFFEIEYPTSLGKLNNRWANFVIAYDLIPLLFQELYLPHEHLRVYYFHKLEYFKKADIFFAISEQTKSDLVEHLNIDEKKIKVISLDCSEIFKPLSLEDLQKAKIELKQIGIDREFILYNPSGFDKRKNIEGLIKAFSLLDHDLKDKYKLVITSKIDEVNLANLKSYAKEHKVEDSVIFTGYVSDETLVKLYNLCSLFVHPSFYEGFGLPVLEAMRCEAPVICSNNSALKDIVKNKDAMFDPYKPEEIAEKISLVLRDYNFRKQLIENAKEQSKRFSWDKAVETILETMEEYKTWKK